MTRKSYVLVLLLAFTLFNCGQKGLECEICGEFEVVNFSKNELNSTDNDAVSIRRNLSLNEFDGADYYTIWSWDEEKPDSSWTENMEKNLEIVKSSLSIEADGTWSWSLIAEETFQSSPYFGNTNYRVNKEYSETGTWKYLNPCQQYISLELEKAVLNNEVAILDENNPNEVLEIWPISTDKKITHSTTNRSFHVSRSNDLSNHLTLESIEDNRKVNLETIYDASYGLTEGNIMLTLSEQVDEGKLASRMK
ncbi:MAG: hypothetical protein GQ574_02190 [Crocinitomix sp.]|nr:hypothetical protein [Crocinitomix sp.]